TGHFSTLIENDGDTSFYSSTHGVYLLNDNIGLTLNGGLVGPGTIGGWDAIHAEASGENYKVLWKNADGAYSEWTVNSAGQFIGSNGVGNVIDVEEFYNVDLNNDGQTGHFSTLIENDGDTSFYSSTHGVYLLNDNIGLTLNGGLVGPGTIGGWDAIHAEASGENYKVLWKNADGAYSEWTVNSAGQFIGSNGVGNVIDVEEFYNVDLNNDGRTGHFTTTLETNGSTTLASSTRGVYLINDSIELTLNGAKTGPNSFPGWQALHAEAFEDGFKVLWKNEDGAFSEWTVNANGEFVSSEAIEDVIDVESFYQYDLNGDGNNGYDEPRLSPFMPTAGLAVSAREASDNALLEEPADLLKFASDLLPADEIEDDFSLLSSGGSEQSGNEGSAGGHAGSLSKEFEGIEDDDLVISTLLEDDAFLL
ncbi:hypothetical protein, partial [Ruegeria atlantica]|uniref:hypothetical protein n=1 Tax=Ruegeria atlantica TaxID=81569 RepID=UPI001C2BC859